MKAVILVGGQGTRLRPLTLATPKPMVPLANKPFVSYVLEHLKENGIEDIVFSMGYLPEGIKSYFGDGSGFGINLTYVVEDHPLGTAGAVKNVEEYVRDGDFLVLNGDILTDLDIRAMIERHRSKEAVGTISLTPVEDPTAYGLVSTGDGGEVLGFLEKPSWDQIDTNLINAGIYVLKGEVLAMIPAGVEYSFERGVFPRLVGKGLYGFSSTAYWMDIGTPEKYLQAHYDILEKNVETSVSGCLDSDFVCLQGKVNLETGAKLVPPVIIGDGTTIKAGARVGRMAVIGPGCTIAAGCAIEESVVQEGARLQEGVRVRQSIIAGGADIGPGTVVAGGAIVGENAAVEGDNILINHIRIYPDTVVKKGSIKF
ncbi:D-glycero-alpha-D-manno-heptose 1-phosphate guanylyltransferase [bacterium BMS3Abin01]|nr:D-glycero-alpha-D-manno-heptose 1-phosphate guanylyltransferase [bacterium BMS3Abin01]HDY69928.1 NDP-sugar synthase [Actinomycetota bacterium]